jgi:hypothetical protein
VIPLFFSTVMQNDSCRSDPKTTSKKSTATTTPSPKGPPGTNRLPPGVWGGLHVSLEATDKDASLEFDCAHGVISGPISLDRNGNFDVAGGPVRSGQEHVSNARYSGTVRNGAMTLKVRVSNPEVKGEFSLALGKSGKISKCY